MIVKPELSVHCIAPKHCSTYSANITTHSAWKSYNNSWKVYLFQFSKLQTRHLYVFCMKGTSFLDPHDEAVHTQNWKTHGCLQKWNWKDDLVQVMICFWHKKICENSYLYFRDICDLINPNKVHFHLLKYCVCDLLITHFTTHSTILSGCGVAFVRSVLYLVSW